MSESARRMFSLILMDGQIVQTNRCNYNDERIMAIVANDSVEELQALNLYVASNSDEILHNSHFEFIGSN